MNRLLWAEGAACVGLWDLFDVPERVKPNPAQVAQARAVCAQCPVRPTCDDFQRGAPMLDGIWAGTIRRSSRERGGHRTATRLSTPTNR